MRRKLRTDKEKNEDIWPTEKKKNKKQKKQVFGPWRRKRTKTSRKIRKMKIWRKYWKRKSGRKTKEARQLTGNVQFSPFPDKTNN